MADIKISELPEKSSIVNADQLLITDSEALNTTKIIDFSVQRNLIESDRTTDIATHASDPEAHVWSVFDSTIDQSVAVTADGGRTFNYTASNTSWVIPVGSTSGQLNELFSVLPKTANTTNMYFNFADGEHTFTSQIVVPSVIYSIEIQGNTSDFSKSTTKSVTLTFDSINQSIRFQGGTPVLSGVKIKHLNATSGLQSAIFGLNSNVTVRYCYLEGTIGQGALCYLVRGQVSVYDCVFANGYYQTVMEGCMGAMRTCETRDQPATTYQAGNYGLLVYEAAHVGYASTNALLGATGNVVSSFATLLT